jgi:RHS repeat-associated protein
MVIVREIAGQKTATASSMLYMPVVLKPPFTYMISPLCWRVLIRLNLSVLLVPNSQNTADSDLSILNEWIDPMLTQLRSLLCEYHYDPLDRLTSHTQPNAPVHQRFYCKSRLATEIQGALRKTIFQSGDQVLGQQQRQGDSIDVALLATDQQRSVLQTLQKDNLPQPIAYTPYGHHRAESGLSSLLGFNGERADPVTGHYLLGNGYRAFNPVLMRFNSPDSWSPFGKGGLNAYAYCEGNPVNRVDPTGHMVLGVKGLLSILPSNIKGSFVGYYVGAKAPLLGLKNGDSLVGAAMHANGARLGPGVYATSDINLAKAFLKQADPKSGAKMFGVHHTGELKVRPYGPGLHPDADPHTIAQSGTTYRIPNTQYDNLIFTETSVPGPASGATAASVPPRSPGGAAAAVSVRPRSSDARSAPIPAAPPVHRAPQIMFGGAALAFAHPQLPPVAHVIRYGGSAPGA